MSVVAVLLIGVVLGMLLASAASPTTESIKGRRNIKRNYTPTSDFDHRQLSPGSRAGRIFGPLPLGRSDLRRALK
jgi:hypothetical protein